jgi:hypothetical protein
VPELESNSLVFMVNSPRKCLVTHPFRILHQSSGEPAVEKPAAPRVRVAENPQPAALVVDSDEVIATGIAAVLAAGFDALRAGHVSHAAGA